ncbi:MAG TPA: hypothetical protein VK578_12480 [Edaphobacter sp.]|nr:hypothetical protein [Edaphobacter sp.]
MAVRGQHAAVHTIPARNVEQELLVPVFIAERGPFWFAIDSGIARTLMDREVATNAHLSVKEFAPFATTRLNIGGQEFQTAMELRNLNVPEYQWASDQPLAGVLGMDFFQSFIVTLDYDAAVITLQDPSLAFQPEGANAIPLTLRDSLPYITAKMKLAGQPPGNPSFMLDTSTGDAINDGSFAHLGAKAVGPDLGRAEYLQIGPFRFSGVNGTSGPSKIGGELLHRFLVTIDAPHRRLFLLPSRHFGDAFLFDTSGLDLERCPRGFNILRVFPRTPGQDSGLAPGDVILSIDGQPAALFPITQVRLMFQEVANHALFVDRNGAQLTITVKLRKLL